MSTPGGIKECAGVVDEARCLVKARGFSDCARKRRMASGDLMNHDGTPVKTEDRNPQAGRSPERRPFHQ